VSKTTRINRPTTATSTKPHKGTMVHQSTDYRWVRKPGEAPQVHGDDEPPAKEFRKVGPGRTL